MCATDQRTGAPRVARCGGVLAGGAGNPQNHSRLADTQKDRQTPAFAGPRGVRMLFVFKMGFTWGFVTSFSRAFNLI